MVFRYQITSPQFLSWQILGESLICNIASHKFLFSYGAARCSPNRNAQ